MYFKQYCTGRALHSGYGFIAKSDGIDCDRSTFKEARDLSRMPAHSTVLEMHAVDDTRTALIMNRVETMGGSTAVYCYDHVLISEGKASQTDLLSILDKKYFMTESEFLHLEDHEGVPLETKEIQLSSWEPEMPDGISDARLSEVLPTLLGYIWHLCDLRRRGEQSFSGAEIILPNNFDMKRLIAFFACAVLPYLPEGLKRQASAVFGVGVTSAFFGVFPSNTVCYITTENRDSYTPSFRFTNGEINAKGYTDRFYTEMGRCLMNGRFPERVESVLERVPEWRDNFECVYRMEHLELIFQSKRRGMDVPVKFILPEYNELKEKLVSGKKNEKEARFILREFEKGLLDYWHDARERENQETPVKLYQALIGLAITCPDDTLWRQWAEELSQPTRLLLTEKEAQKYPSAEENERILDLITLLDEGAAFDSNWDRFAELVRKRLEMDDTLKAPPPSMRSVETGCGLLKKLTEVFSKSDFSVYPQFIPAYENTLRTCWNQARQSEKTPVEVYRFLVETALASKDEEGWKSWLDALEQPCAILSDVADYDLLLDNQLYEKADQQRYSMLIKRRLSAEQKGEMALKALRRLPAKVRQLNELQRQIQDAVLQHMDSYSVEELSGLFIYSGWKEQKELIQERVFIVIGNDLKRLKYLKELILDAMKKIRTNELTYDAEKVKNHYRSISSSELRDKICAPSSSPEEQKKMWEDAYDQLGENTSVEEITLLIQAASHVTLDQGMAGQIANLIKKQQTENVEPVKSNVFKLFEAQPFADEMWKLLEKYQFQYDRADWKKWEEVDKKKASEEITQSIEEIQSMDSLKGMPKKWKDWCDKWRRDWNTFFADFPGKEEMLKNCVQRLLAGFSLREIRAAADIAKENEDDFGSAVKEAVSGVFKEHMEEIVHKQENAEILQIIPELMEQIGMDINEESTPGRYGQFIDQVNKINKDQNEENLMKSVNALIGLDKHIPDSVLRGFAANKINSVTALGGFEIHRNLLSHMDNLEDGWKAYFAEKGLQKPGNVNPWKNAPYLMNQIIFLCGRLTAWEADETIKKALQQYLNTGEWRKFIQKMEDDRACQSFYHDKTRKAPKLRDLLSQHS